MVIQMIITFHGDIPSYKVLHGVVIQSQRFNIPWKQHTPSFANPKHEKTFYKLGVGVGVTIFPHLGGNKQYKSMVMFADFPYYNALFGLVI